MNQKLKTTICFIVFIPIFLLLYTLLHEGGHALVILAYGGTIDNFVLGLNAHVSAHGADFTTFGAALNHAAGMLFPTIIGAIAICFYRPKINFAGYHICYLCCSVSLTFSMFAWIFIPIISLFTIPPQDDDVTKFINTVNVYPLFISLGALLLAAVFVFFANKKGVFRRIKELSSSMRKSITNRKHLLIITIGIGFLSMIAAFVVVYNIAFPSAVFNTSIVTDNVLENAYQECTFKIEKDKTYSVNLTVLSQGMITAVRIMDENGELAYQDLAEEFTADFTIPFQKGIYTLSLTYLADYEAIERFFESTEQDILPEWSDYYKEVLGREINYSASFSIKIR